jgi:hypothetical protein
LRDRSQLGIAQAEDPILQPAEDASPIQQKRQCQKAAPNRRIVHRLARDQGHQNDVETGAEKRREEMIFRRVFLGAQQSRSERAGGEQKEGRREHRLRSHRKSTQNKDQHYHEAGEDPRNHQKQRKSQRQVAAGEVQKSPEAERLPDFLRKQIRCADAVQLDTEHGEEHQPAENPPERRAGGRRNRSVTVAARYRIPRRGRQPIGDL